MSNQNPIADMFTRIRNAAASKHTFVEMPSSKPKLAIASLLKSEGYIVGFSVNETNAAKPILVVELKYFEGESVIDLLQVESKPSIRKYKKVDELPVVNGGLGIAIMSTNQGIITAREAKKKNIGGEYVGKVA